MKNKARFWGVTFSCTHCGEFKWRINGREHSQEVFFKLSDENRSGAYELLSISVFDIMCWSCQFKNKKQDKNFRPPEPKLIDPENSTWGKEIGESINKLLENAVFEN